LPIAYFRHPAFVISKTSLALYPVGPLWCNSAVISPRN
jgi:hypothetical protein